jgi:hypothetical protein
MRDGATPHCTASIFFIMNEHFGHKVTALDHWEQYGSDTDWPAYSPDVT